MLLYVVNVDACIHIENYRIFFYEPVAKKKLELFEASWNVNSLASAFIEIAANINRRAFQNQDYQIIVCVRRRQNESFRETSLYAKMLVKQALERSGAEEVITGAYTGKVTVLFQVEQPFFGSAPKIAVWEEELVGLERLKRELQLEELSKQQIGDVQILGIKAAKKWEKELAAALKKEDSGYRDEIVKQLKMLIVSGIEEEELWEKEEPEEQQEIQISKQMMPEEIDNEYAEMKHFDYISHRLRSLMDGKGLNRSTEIIYWPIAAKSSSANRISMLALVDLLRMGREITKEDVWNCLSDRNPDYEKHLLDRYRRALEGYKIQLSEKKERIAQEIGEKPEKKHASPLIALSLPEPSFPLQQRIEEARQQLESSRFSLQKSKRAEVTRRVEEISQSLLVSFSGIEEELVSYEKEVAESLYREIDADPNVGFAKKDGASASSADTLKTILEEQKTRESRKQRCKDEAYAKELIEQWKQDMRLLTDCAELTKASVTVCFLAVMLAFAFLPYLLYQGSVLMQSGTIYMAVAVFLVLAGVLLLKRVFVMPGYFIRQISKSYYELEKRLNAVLDGYKERAEGFQKDIVSWLEREYDLQRRKEARQTAAQETRLSKLRAWHLANIQKKLTILEIFQTFAKETETFAMDSAIEKRIMQPMDYTKKELWNEIYWPVIETERKEGKKGE